jgi:rubrerythrin
VYIDEVTDYIAAGKSVMFYNHRQRKKAEEYFESFRQRFAAEKDISGKPVFALTFPKRAVRDYFIIAATDEHRQKIEHAISGLLTGPFGREGICKFRAGFSDIGINVCPFCGYGPPIEIVYGMPTYEAEQAAKRGEIMLGGCCVTGSDPQWCCPSCRRKF